MNSDTRHTLGAIEGYLASKADHGDALARSLRSMLVLLMAAPKPGDALPFTVFGSNPRTGQLLVEHVFAEDGLSAFAAVAQKLKTARDPAINFVVAVPSHLDEAADEFMLPGESLVDSVAVLEQPDVFGAPPPQPDFATAARPRQ